MDSNENIPGHEPYDEALYQEIVKRMEFVRDAGVLSNEEAAFVALYYIRHDRRNRPTK